MRYLDFLFRHGFLTRTWPEVPLTRTWRVKDTRHKSLTRTWSRLEGRHVTRRCCVRVFCVPPISPPWFPIIIAR